MYGRLPLLAGLCMACYGSISGCAKGPAPSTVTAQPALFIATDPRRVQSVTMSFAQRYITAMADIYDRMQLTATTPEARLMAQRMKILSGTGAMGNAVDPQPVAGLMDMAIMVRLNRQIAEDPWVAREFGPEAAEALVAVLQRQEQDIWAIAASHVSPERIDELDQLVKRWRDEHPDQRYISGARLADFPESARSGGDSVFVLINLDPFHGLDPAVKEVSETRVMAERLFFYLRHMPMLMSWQADTLFDQMVADPEMTKLFGNAATIAGSSKTFTDASAQFSKSSSEVAQSVERFRLQLPDQQRQLVSDLGDLIARQREGAVGQATTQVSLHREMTIQQLATSIAEQQELMTRNLQLISERSIDHTYQAARSLMLITVGTVLLAFVLYRRLLAPRPERKGNP